MNARTASPGFSDWLLIIVPGLIWGASFLFIAMGLESVGPNGVTFLRILIGFLTLSLVPAARRPVERSDRAGIALLGLLWFAFPLSMFPFAEQHVSSALTGMLNAATPIFAVAVASLLARTFPTPGVLAGVALGVLGAAAMAVPGIGAGRSSALGIVLIMAAVFSYGVAVNLARPLQIRNGALPVVWRAQAVALLLTAPLGVPAVLAAQHWSLRSVLALLALGAGGTAIANVLSALAAGRLGAARASTTTFFMPGVALLLGVIVLGERVAPIAIAGAALCLLGAWVVRRASR
jgi:drug/metabolite transporter (DMT)-like permease